MKCIKLTYESPLNGTVYCEGLVNEDDYRVDFDSRGVRQLYNRGQEMLLFMAGHCEDLKEALPEELKSLVLSALFGALVEKDRRMYLQTQIYVRDQPTEEQYTQIYEWVVGQLSDGWGESVEQEAFLEEDVQFDTTTFNEDSCEFEDDYEDHTALYFLHPWQYGPGWYLNLVSEEPAELDIPEEDRLAHLERSVKELQAKVKELEFDLYNKI